jgi:hypothetical protein
MFARVASAKGGFRLKRKQFDSTVPLTRLTGSPRPIAATVLSTFTDGLRNHLSTFTLFG